MGSVFKVIISDNKNFLLNNVDREFSNESFIKSPFEVKIS